MSAEARRQPDPFERFASELEKARWEHDFLAEYVDQLSKQKHEDDVFQRLALDGPQASGSSSPARILSESYAATNAEQKAALRRLWHDTIRREAYDHDDLRARLSWRYLI